MRLYKIDKKTASEQLALAQDENDKELSELPRDVDHKEDRLVIFRDNAKIARLRDYIYFSHGDCIELDEEEFSFLINCR